VIRSSLLIAVLTVIAAPTLPVSAEDYVIDPTHSSVVFKIGHLGASNFFGRFNEIRGEVSFDEKHLRDAHVRVVVPAGSVDTNDPDRDNHVKSPELLGAEEFPEIVFEAKGFKKGKGKDTYEVKGKLTFHGITKDVKVTVKRVGTADHPRFGKRIGFSCQFTIRRTDYGIAFPTNMLSDEVELMVGIEAMVPQKKEPAGD